MPTNPLTPEREAEIQLRRNSITPGRWYAVSLGIDHEREFAASKAIVAATHKQEHVVTDHTGGVMPSATAEFIAHAPADIDDLLAEVRRLRAENDTLRSEMNPHV